MSVRSKGGKRRLQATSRVMSTRRVVAAGLTVTLTGTLALVMGGSPAAADAATALQAVQVRLGSDGAITGITSNLVSKSSDSTMSSKNQALDPSEVGGELPLRVLISYQHGSQQGTDLRDIEGKSGTFVVNVSVQNTSVRPGSNIQDGRQSFALTGTPLTVVASADLGDKNLAHVVTKDVAANGPATTGVLSTASNGNAQVLYSALLVPPALPAATTFTLVEKTTSFKIPVITIAAQPGVVTDTSASNLIRSAFGGAASTDQARNLALGLVGGVNTQLSDVLNTLDTMTSQLQAGSADLTGPVVQSLRDSTSSLDASLTSLVANLDDAQSCLNGTITDAIGSDSKHTNLAGCAKGAKVPVNVQKQLSGALENLQTLILGPGVSGVGNATKLSDATPPLLFGLEGSSDPLADITSADACNSKITTTTNPALKGNKQVSLLGQVKELSGWFNALSKVNDLCKATITANITASLATIAGTISTASTDFGTAASDLTTTLTDSLNTNVFQDNALSAFYADVLALANNVNALAAGKINASTINSLNDALAEAKTAKNNLALGVASIVNKATAQVDALTPLVDGDASKGTRSAAELATSVHAICDNQPTTAPDPSETDLIAYLSSVSTNCSSTNADDLALQIDAIKSALATDLAAWGDVKTSATGLSGDLTTIGAKLDAIQATVTALGTGTVGNPLGGILNELTTVVSGLTGGLSDVLATATTATPAGTGDKPDCDASALATAPDGSVAKIYNDFRTLYCANEDTATNAATAISDFGTKAGETKTALVNASTNVATEQTPQTNVTTLFENFNAQLAAAVAAATDGTDASLDGATLRLSKELGTTINGVNAKLSKLETSLTSQITSVVKQATGENGGSGINQAKAQLNASAQLLLAKLIGNDSLQSVLDGNNLNAEQAGRSVGNQLKNTSDFTATQGAARSQSATESRALTQSIGTTLDQAFGIDAGSAVVTTVYTFQVGGN